MKRTKSVPPIIDAEYVEISEHAYKKPKEEKFERRYVTICSDLSDRIVNLFYLVLVLIPILAIFDAGSDFVYGILAGLILGRLTIASVNVEAYIKVK